MKSRIELRSEARKDVTATILGHPDVTVPCSISNYSKSGLCISVRQQIAEGDAVKVEWADHFLLGRVRRVTVDGPEYQIGLELLYCSRWNGEDSFRTLSAC
jgi:hypothetical protein